MPLIALNAPLRATLLLVIAGLAIAAILLFDGEQDEASVKVLNRGIAAEPESLDMQKARTKQAGDVQRDIGEGLVGYLETGELVGAAAERWDVSADGTEYTFYLRQNLRWSNGDPLTAKDFVYSFRRLVDPATAAYYANTLIDVENAAAIIRGEQPLENLGVAALDPQRFRIRLTRPVPYFLNLLSHPVAYPAHAATITEHEELSSRADNFVGNGAYVLTRRVPGSLIELRRNPRFRDAEQVYFEIVRHHIVVDEMAELARYRSGELDITASVPPDAFRQMRAERPDELRVAPYLGIYYYGFNLTQPPFKGNAKLREALSLAIDREELVENVVGRGETAAYSLVPGGVGNYASPRLPLADMEPAKRHERARRLYEEAGYGPDEPAPVELRYISAEFHARIALAVQGMWRDVLGLEASLVNEEFQVLLSSIRARKHTRIFQSSWLGDYNDAHTFLQLFESDNPSNLTGYSSEEFDAYMRRAAEQTDASRRRLFLEEAERELLADHVIVPVYFYVSKHMLSPRVKGWGDNVLDYHYSQYLSFAE